VTYEVIALLATVTIERSLRQGEIGMEPQARQLSNEWIISALGRAGFGARPDDLADIMRIGFPAWVEDQLSPNEDEDTAVHVRLTDLRLRFRHGAGVSWSAIDEMRPVALLDKPIETAWSLMVQRAATDGAERRRPREEVTAATILRAVHSRWQLREVLIGFWHDHFNVDAYGTEEVSVALPTYDRDVIRRHALGNFRAFLEAVGTSTAMLYFLSNRSSRAGAANENYGRELFELHTLGAEAYLNDRYDRWRGVPGALKGAPIGYIDEDVYESARAFTGWTVEDGSAIDAQRRLPATGRFVYVDAWHDGYQKRVLAHEFQEFAPAMADGRHVLDLVAYHPATARFICTKLCRRLIADDPPPGAIEAATRTWTKARHARDQIGQTVRVILLSPEFAASQGTKVRRPLALVAAFARATGLDLVPTEQLWNGIANAGQRLFGWTQPNGLPDRGAYFLGANSMRQRWALILGVAANAWGTGEFPKSTALFDGPVTPRRVAFNCLATMQGAVVPTDLEALLRGLGSSPDQPLGDPAKPDVTKRIAHIAALAAIAPGFQTA
jgi:uncharacterized protein (DUF1800 family)